VCWLEVRGGWSSGPSIIGRHSWSDFDDGHLLSDFEHLYDALALVQDDQGVRKSADRVHAGNVMFASEIGDLEKLKHRVRR
jgi:hypothetical protein